ncbi:hypothetical protein P280DRAFT_521130 [Massarina eburnea CBS 473.64]|uniref:Uncharacterized protein n=1 Tax=Massarina eburnea CBS 473.64 TaxID=1395130 RepID=A0A6A6RPE4_9PLEO|nr:hypothetical protein P280DRAFT_521130 [Massarina eburnea CBS 473.64]
MASHSHVDARSARGTGSAGLAGVVARILGPVLTAGGWVEANSMQFNANRYRTDPRALQVAGAMDAGRAHTDALLGWLRCLNGSNGSNGLGAGRVPVLVRFRFKGIWGGLAGTHRGRILDQMILAR